MALYFISTAWTAALQTIVPAAPLTALYRKRGRLCESGSEEYNASWRIASYGFGLRRYTRKKNSWHRDGRAEVFLKCSRFIAYLVLYFFNRHLLPNKFTLIQMVMFDCSFSQLCLLRNQHLILYLMKISTVLGLSSHDRPSFILSVISIPLKSVCWWGKSQDLYSVNSYIRKEPKVEL